MPARFTRATNGLRERLGLFAGALSALVLLSAAPAAGAEIIYVHGSGVGSTLMAMNDDGSDAHVLLSAANVPPNDQLAYPSLLPNGSTLVFQGITDQYDNLSGPSGDSGANYGGLYTFSGGNLARLSAPPAPVANAGSEDTSPSITPDGRVVYEALASTFFSDGGVSGSNEQLLVRPLAGGAASEWQTSPQTSFGRDAADPANGGLIAYTTNPPIQVAIGNQAGTGTTIVAGQPQGFNPAWSPDGNQLVDVDWTDSSSTGTGYSAGIWLFPAHAGATGREIVADPNPPASEFHAGSFNNPTFAGPNEIVFQARVGGATNLYEASTSCNACSLPGPGIKQLTSDGTASSPDTYPAWTSQTLTELGHAGTGTGAGTGTVTGTGTGTGTGAGRSTVDELQDLKLAARSVRAGKPLTFDVTLKAPAKITIQILRFVPASGHGKHHRKAHYTLIGVLTFNGKQGLNKLRVTKVHGRKLAPSGYEAKVSAGGKPHIAKLMVGR
jgi:hypothetical protein